MMKSSSQERPARVAPGLVMTLVVVFLGLLGTALVVVMVVGAVRDGAPTVWTLVGVVGGVLIDGLAALVALGLFVVHRHTRPAWARSGPSPGSWRAATRRAS